MRSLLFASVAIVLVATSAPGLITRFLDRPASAERASVAEEPLVMEPAPDPESALSEPSAHQNATVEIEAGRDGHFYVDAEVNFSTVRLMVDTGATVTALRLSDAEAAGVRLIDSDFTYPVATANGTAHAAEVELDSVVIEGIELTSVRALVLPDEQLFISLLGGSFLNRLASYQVAGGTLVFER